MIMPRLYEPRDNFKNTYGADGIFTTHRARLRLAGKYSESRGVGMMNRIIIIRQVRLKKRFCPVQQYNCTQ